MIHGRLTAFAVLSIAILAPDLHATVCNFDDLPQLQNGNLGLIPTGYCGINWYGENGVGYYFTTSTQYHGTFYAHSQPNATVLDASHTYGFSFISPAVFNGFWAAPRTTYYTDPNSPQLLVQFILSLNGNTVYTSPFAAVPNPNGAFISTGYSGQVDSVTINSLGYYPQYGEYTAGGEFSIDDVTFNSVCGTPAIAPSTIQDFPTSGGTGSVTVTYPVGCPWTASSVSSWITITSGASGTGNGSVAYTVAANPSGGTYREGSLTVAGLNLPVQEAGIVEFQATGGTTSGGAGTTNVVAGTTLSYNGSFWPIDMGQIAVQDSANTLPSPSYTPPNFSDSSYQVVFPFSSTPPCTDTITASAGTVSQPVTLTGVYLGKVVFDDDPNNYQTGKQFCQSKTLTEITDFAKIQVQPGTALEIEGYPSSGGSVFFVNSQEVALTPGLLVLMNPGQTITLLLANGGTSAVTADSTSPLPSSTFTPTGSAQPVTSLPSNPAGLYQIDGDFNPSGAVFLDNAVVYVSGNVTIDGGVSGVGAIIATGNIDITGPVTVVTTSAAGFMFIAGGNVSISAPAKGSCTQPQSLRHAFRIARAKVDLNGDGTVNVSDVQQAIDQALGTAAPTADLNGNGTVNVSDVQTTINEASIAGCSQ